MAERVWDRFLTEQDKAHVAASVRRPVGFGEKPAILMVDNYRWVIGDEPQPILEQIKTWPGGVRASVVDGTTYRFRMIVAEECSYDRHEACHAINLFDMHQKYADVLPLAEVLQWMRDWRAAHPLAGAERPLASAASR